MQLFYGIVKTKAVAARFKIAKASSIRHKTRHIRLVDHETKADNKTQNNLGILWASVKW